MDSISRRETTPEVWYDTDFGELTIALPSGYDHLRRGKGFSSPALEGIRTFAYCLRHFRREPTIGGLR